MNPPKPCSNRGNEIHYKTTAIPAHYETAKEGAWRLRISRNTIYRWGQAQIPTIRINKRVVYYDLSNPPIPQHAKLTPDAVRQIRATPGPQRRVATLFRVSQMTVGLVRRRLIWKHVI